jgi:hypothetical protein
MPYRVRIDPLAMRQIDEFAAYLRDYNEDFALEQIDRTGLAKWRSILHYSGKSDSQRTGYRQPRNGKNS